MPFQTRVLFIALACCLTSAGRGQAPAWSPLRFGKLSLKYPPAWRSTKENYDGQTYVTITPDSMHRLSMKMMEIYELPVSGDHNYANFKKGFTTALNALPDGGAKVLKTAEISFKDHKTMYAEIIRSSLPARVYAINAGTRIYIIFMLLSRHVNVPDPKMESDEKAILNTIAFDQ